MCNNENKKIPKIIALNSGREFAKLICNRMNQLLKKKGEKNISIDLVASKEITFANKEVKFIINESIRGDDVYIVQLLDDPLSQKSINDNLMALATAINASYYSDCNSITVVIPQFPYARQDKKKERESITAKLVGQLLEISGANKIITLDIHSEAIEGFFEKLKMENMHMGKFIIDYTKKHIGVEDLVVVSPDIGSAKRGDFLELI